MREVAKWRWPVRSSGNGDDGGEISQGGEILGVQEKIIIFHTERGVLSVARF